MAGATDFRALFKALEVMQGAPDKASMDQANAWLQDFQHSNDAWTASDYLLSAPDTPMPVRLFAAQTLRSKVVYDLGQIQETTTISHLREVLLSAFERFHLGPKPIITQLSLALSGFALQVTAWQDPVGAIIDKFSQNPSMVPALLQFLAILPEEVMTNTRIPITDDDYKVRAPQLLTDMAPRVIGILALYLNAPGVTAEIQKQVFTCLRSWLVAGEIVVSDLVPTQMLEFSFEALASEQLFDEAVDVVCAIIHETQEIDDNIDVIQLIIPRVIALKTALANSEDDPDKFKGLARIFAEAGETYRMLILRHPENFIPIIEAIGMCSAYHDLDIAPISFTFWERLAQILGKQSTIPPLFIEAYKNLMMVIIRHLHFPADSSSLTGKEMDDFRSFRHIMGDTLKDCCYVIGTDVCLLAAYDMITVALARRPQVSWQEIEAPLFSLRSMGAEIDTADEVAVPKILELIPSLPSHPRIQYAALLIISRYTEWINAHPQHVATQIQYVSQGFEIADTDVNAAAGQALKYLCQDCKSHLTAFLPQLHTFISSAGARLSQDDKLQVYEAIAHVISAMPMEQAAVSLQTFSNDLLLLVHGMAEKAVPSSAQDIKDVCDALENLEAMLNVIKSFGEHLPPACQDNCVKAWTIFDAFLIKFGDNYEIMDRVTRVLRHGIVLFGSTARPVSTSLMQRMSMAFQQTGFSGYLWIAGKLITSFGLEKDQTLHVSIGEFYATATLKVITLIQEKSAGNIPDVLEDYVQVLKQLLDIAPDIYFDPATLVQAMKVVIAALTVVQSEVVWGALEHIRSLLSHPCLDRAADPPPSFPIFASVIDGVINQDGEELTNNLLFGLVGDTGYFPEDAVSTIITTFRSLAALWPRHLVEWLPGILQRLPPSAPMQARTKFLAEVDRCLTSGQVEKIKYAVLDFHRASRAARERRRGVPGE